MRFRHAHIEQFYFVLTISKSVVPGEYVGPVFNSELPLLTPFLLIGVAVVIKSSSGMSKLSLGVVKAREILIGSFSRFRFELGVC